MLGEEWGGAAEDSGMHDRHGLTQPGKGRGGCGGARQAQVSPVGGRPAAGPADIRDNNNRITMTKPVPTRRQLREGILGRLFRA